MSTVGPSPAWRVELFGGLRVLSEQQELSRFRTRRTASLLAYLAFFNDRSHPREVLTDMFWPEANMDAGRQSLRMALSALRESLEVGVPSGYYLESDRATVRLKNVSTDVSDFETGLVDACDATGLARALKLVKGPLLSGSDESWIVAQWLRLEEAYAQSAVRLMDTCAHQGETKQGILVGKDAVALLGPREDVHLALMRLYVADDQPTLAVAQFEELEQALDEQWGETPSAAAYKELDSLPKGGRREARAQTEAFVPVRASSFLGRDEEVRAVCELILSGPNRLVTLFGTGGCGKTALAEFIANRLVEEFNSRVWIVEFANLSEPDRIVESVCRVAIGPSDKPESISTLAKSLGDAPSLLILDNMEQLLPAGSLIVKSILESSPGLRVLTTSRRLLSIDGEQAFPVPTLPVPASWMPLSELAQIPSVALFVDRARANRPEFKLLPENAPAVAEICRRLEGLPLAIELAAAKVVTHSPAQILSKLGTSTDFLVSRRTDVADRHRSLRATLDWSIGLLDPSKREAFYMLGVFRGGFTCGASEVVTGLKGFGDDLANLVESSLVVSESDSENPRFRLLEPVREFAAEGLDEKVWAQVRRRHFEHFLTVANGLGSGAPEPSNRLWLDTLHSEHENLCAAFESVFDGVIDPGEALRFSLRIRPFLRPRAHSAVWRGLLFRLQEFTKASGGPDFKARLAVVIAQLNSNAVDADTMKRLYSEALALSEASGDRESIGLCHLGLGGYYKISSDYPRSEKHYLEAAKVFEELDDPMEMASTVRQLAMTYVSMGDHAKSYETLQSALPYARRSGDSSVLAWTLTDVGVEHALHGKFEESEVCFKEAHQICEKTNDAHMRSIVYWQQAETEHRTGRSDDSIETHKLCVVTALDADFRDGLKWMLVSYGCALQGAGKTVTAVRVLAKTMKWRADENRNLTGDEVEIIEPAKQGARDALGDAEFERLWKDSEAADLDRLVEELIGKA